MKWTHRLPHDTHGSIAHLDHSPESFPSRFTAVAAQLVDRGFVTRQPPRNFRARRLVLTQGTPLEEVADLLGHKDVRMLAQVYRHRVKRVVGLTEAQGRMLGEG